MSRAPLEGVVSTDVCILGAGMTGCAAALEVARRGRRAVVLESRTVGAGASGATLGHVATGLGTHYEAAVAALGATGALEVWETHRENHARLRELLAELKAPCGYDARGGFALAVDRDEAHALAEDEDRLHADGFAGEFLDHYMLESRFDVRGFVGAYWSMDDGAIDSRGGRGSEGPQRPDLVDPDRHLLRHVIPAEQKQAARRQGFDAGTHGSLDLPRVVEAPPDHAVAEDEVERFGSLMRAEFGEGRHDVAPRAVARAVRIDFEGRVFAARALKEVFHVLGVPVASDGQDASISVVPSERGKNLLVELPAIARAVPRFESENPGRGDQRSVEGDLRALAGLASESRTSRRNLHRRIESKGAFPIPFGSSFPRH